MTSWREDAEILERLDQVADLLDENATITQIGEATGMSRSTARRDIERVEELWKERSEHIIQDKRTAYERRGRKDVHWRRDPEIMVRLEQVAQLLTQNARAWQIAEATGVSYSTAERDIARVEALWSEAAMQGVEVMFSRNVAQIRRVQQEAYDSYYKAKKGARDIRWLKLVLECEAQLIGLFGTKQPEKLALTDPSGEKEYGGSDFTEEERVARIAALLDKARARRDSEAS